MKRPIEIKFRDPTQFALQFRRVARSRKGGIASRSRKAGAKARCRRVIRIVREDGTVLVHVEVVSQEPARLHPNAQPSPARRPRRLWEPAGSIRRPLERVGRA